MVKERLDKLVVDRGLAGSLDDARILIRAGKIYVNETIADKPGIKYDHNAEIRSKKTGKYVSRGGLKLEKAIDHFGIDLLGLTCVDIGASTGGFTDCLLQHGAAKVYAVDVAYGQFSWKLRQDKRVVLFERFNARMLSRREIADTVQLAVIDASFISLAKLLPPLVSLLDARKRIIALIKPQFELPRERVGKGGVVIGDKLHQEAIEKVTMIAAELNLSVVGLIESPITGPKGNKEFLADLQRSDQ